MRFFKVHSKWTFAGFIFTLYFLLSFKQEAVNINFLSLWFNSIPKETMVLKTDLLSILAPDFRATTDVLFIRWRACSFSNDLLLEILRFFIYDIVFFRSQYIHSSHLLINYNCNLSSVLFVDAHASVMSLYFSWQRW